MAAMSSQKTLSSKTFLTTIKPLLGDIELVENELFYWSPKDRTIAINNNKLRSETGQWSLLHELSHARLKHTTYKSDFELLSLEAAAWDEARVIAQQLGMMIANDYIQDCLDTYRDWLHQRSTCPTCGTVGLQHAPREYRCHNCLTNWNVSESRFCRAYRRKQTSIQKMSSGSVKNQTTFQ